MYAVQFAEHPGLYGRFPTIAKAKWWGNHESDGFAFTIHRIDGE